MKILSILVRRYVALDRLEDAVSFYETLIGRKAHLRFSYPERNLELAQVDNILFIAGTQESLAPFTATLATFMVDDIRGFAGYLPTIGAEVLEAPKPVPTGWNMLVRHPDGMRVEYVEHRDTGPGITMPRAG
jgi:hypothetical protein